MDFLYLHRTAGRGAEGNHILSLVHALEAEGHTVTIVSPPGVDPRLTAGSAPLDKGAEVSGVSRLWQWLSRQAPQVLFEFVELGYNVYLWFTLPRFLREHPDAVIYERYANFVSAGTSMAKRRGRVAILEANEVAGLERARGLVLRGLALRLERKLFRMTDHIVTVSSFLRQKAIERGAAPEKVHLVPNAIHPERFAVQGSGRDVRAKRGLGAGIVLGFVGWFDHWDKLELLVEALHRLRPEFPDMRLLLVGDGPAMQPLRDKVAQLGVGAQTVLTGPVPRAEVPQYIDAMDICVLPDSNPFGSPMVLFEFMAMGCAVVAPDLPPIRDVLENGRTGLIVPPGSVDAITASVRRLATDPALRKSLGGAAREKVLSQHTWAANARRVVQMARDSGGKG